MGGILARLAYRSMMGYMQFSAIRLAPTESLQCNSTPGYLPEGNQLSTSLFQRWKAWCMGSQTHFSNQDRPLLLWGLTLGIMADFLDMLPPHTAVQLWKYPNFTALDLRFIINVLTYRLRKHNRSQVRSGARPSNTAVDSQTAALPVTKTTATNGNAEHNQVGIGGLGVGRYFGSSDTDPSGSAYAVGIMLRGYYERVRIGIYIIVAWRIALGSTAAIYAWKLLRRLK